MVTEWRCVISTLIGSASTNIELSTSASWRCSTRQTGRARSEPAAPAGRMCQCCSPAQRALAPLARNGSGNGSDRCEAYARAASPCEAAPMRQGTPGSACPACHGRRPTTASASTPQRAAGSRRARGSRRAPARSMR
eukprot:7384103-Prymnesium_polylepis.1